MYPILPSPSRGEPACPVGRGEGGGDSVVSPTPQSPPLKGGEFLDAPLSLRRVILLSLILCFCFFVFLFFIFSGNIIFPGCPCTQINKSAPIRTKRPVRILFPGRYVLAYWTFYFHIMPDLHFELYHHFFSIAYLSTYLKSPR